MDDDAVQREVGRFDPGLPIEEASTPPSSWYTEPELFALERRALLARSWHAVARADQLERPGDFVTATRAGEPLLVLRDAEGELRGFLNVCRHHAALLMAGEGAVERIVCPYHGWCYGLDGRLERAPGLGGLHDLDRAALDLRPLAVERWGPIVLANADPQAAPLAPALADLTARLDRSGWGELRFAARRRYELACNWKVVVDNYLDGGYHVARLHPGLAGQLDMASYRSEITPAGAIQSVAAGGPGAPGPDFAERIGAEALYAWLWPCFMINRYGPVLDTNAVIPLACDRTAIVYDYWFADPEDRAFVERALRASDAVQREDSWICESVQAGLASSGFDRGRYAPRFEAAAHDFHRRLACALQGTAIRPIRGGSGSAGAGSATLPL